jgi:hypothetical protein
MFEPATRKKLKLRMAICGPSGSGKTMTGLRSAFAVAKAIEEREHRKARVAVIDTEHRSASKYQGEAPDGVPFNFDVCELTHYSPTAYTAVLKEAGQTGYDIVMIDSLSHAWEGVGGALDLVDQKADKGGNSFTAWKDVTPMHREMVEAILASPCDVIVTMRSKMDYVLEQDARGKMVPKKVGMAPIQRQGMEYEFDVVCDMDATHTLTVSKTRCSAIDGQRVVKPGAAFMGPILAWLGKGDDPVQQQEQQQTASVQATVLPQATTTVTSKPAPADSGEKTSQAASDRCTVDQAKKIMALAKECKISPEAIQKDLASKGLTKLTDLTAEQALSSIAKLEALKTKKQAEGTF